MIDGCTCVWCRGGKDLVLVRFGCFHVGCKPCLQRHLVNVRNGSNFNCPSCDASCTKPEQGIEGFPLETLQSTVKDISDLVSNGYPESSTIYCKQCKTSRCVHCANLKPKVNDKVTIKEAAKEYKQILDDKTEEISTAKVTVDEKILNLEKTLQDIEENVKMWITGCKQWGEDMKKNIDNIVEENIKKAVRISSKQKTELEEHLRKENNKKKQFENVKKFIDKPGSNSEILDNFEKYIKDLEMCLKRNEDSKMSATRYVVRHKSVKESEKCLRELFGEVYEIGSLSASDVNASWKAGCRFGVTVKVGDILVVEGKNMELYGMNGERKGRIDCKELRKAWNVEFFNGEIYVTDIELREVLVMDENGKVKRRVKLPVREKGKKGELGLGLDRNNGDMYICSYNTSIMYKCSKGGGTATPFITDGLNGPLYMCVTSQHECIVSNVRSHKVCKFSPVGQLLWEYGRYGSGVGELCYPWGLCVDDNDHCFVADFSNHRIHYISPQGHFISFVNNQKVSNPRAITISNDTLIITQLDNTIRVIQCKYKPIK